MSYRPCSIFIITWLLVMLTNNSGCLKPKLTGLEFFTVSTEPIEPQSLALLKLTGRIENLIDSKAASCGFIWSNDEGEISGASPEGGQVLTVSPPSEGNGAFVYNFPVPVEGKVYFFRAWAKLGERYVFADVIRSFALGNVVLQTGNWQVDNDTAWAHGILVGLEALHLTVDSYGHVLSETNSTPELGCSDCLSSNFGVSFNDGPFTSKFDSLKFNTRYFARAYAVSGTKHFYSDKVDTIQICGGWESLKDFRNYRDGVAVSSENHGKAFVGFGCEAFAACTQPNLPADIWAFTGSTGEWGITASSSIPNLLQRTNASAFVIGDTAYYIFGGYQTDSSSAVLPLRDFRKYCISADTWRKGVDPPLACARRVKAVAFSLQDKGYVGSGMDKDGYALQDFWEYTPTSGVWRPVDSIPARINIGGVDQNLGRSDAACFTIGDRAYVGGGIVGPTILRDFWKFIPPEPSDPNDPGKWEFCCFFDKGVPRIEAIAFSIENKGYYGLGYSYNNDVLDDFYEFDPSVPGWTKREKFPGGNRRDALGFSLNGFGYAGSGIQHKITNVITVDMRTDMWKYEPKK
ncbi:MAG: hypothetical protein H7246_18965 [Phycisphaerae bacterium]|nr:hypothetical protein [Saprospiraceae bacterium]